MAKLPSYQQGQRLSASGPSQVYDTREARLEGEAISDVGQAVQGLAGSLNSYLSEKSRADTAIIAKQWSDRTDVFAQDQERMIRTNKNGNVAINGDNVVDLFDSSFVDLYEEAKNLPNSKHRQIAINAIGTARNRYRGQLSDYAAVLHNNWTFSEVERSGKTMGATIAGNPDLYEDKLNEHKQFIMTMPIGAENQQKLLKQADQDAALAYIEHYTNKGKFSEVKKALTSGKIAGVFDAKERQALIEMNESNEREAFSDKVRLEDYNDRKLKEQKEEQRLENVNRLFNMMGSDEGKDRDFAVKYARKLVNVGVLKKEDLNALQTEAKEILTEKSDMTYLNMDLRLKEKRSLKTFVSDVNLAVGRKILDTNDARALINDFYRETKSKKGGDKIYSERKQIGDAFLNDAFKPSGLMAALKPKDAAKLTKAKRIASDYRNGGMDPVLAAVNALRAVDPSHPALLEPNIAAGKAFDAEAEQNLQKDSVKILKNYDDKAASKQVTDKDKRKVLDILRKMKRKQDALKHEGTIREVLEKEKKEGK